MNERCYSFYDAAFDLAAYLFYVEKELQAYNFTMTLICQSKCNWFVEVTLTNNAGQQMNSHFP